MLDLMQRALSIAAIGMGSLLWASTPNAHAQSDDTQDVKAKTQVVQSLGDVPIAVTSIGAPGKQSVLFVHGFMSATASWKKQLMSTLSDDYYLTALDLRGHGSSGKPVETFHYLDTRYMAADIATAIEALALDKPILVAHSYGGLFVMDYIRHYGSDAISGIVFVGSNGGIAEPKPEVPADADKQARIERSRSPNIFINTQWTTAFVDGYLLGSKDINTRDAEMLRVAAMQVPHYVRRALREHNTNNLDVAPKVTVPVVFLAGENHGGARKEVLAFAQKRVKKAKVRTLKDQAHMAHWRAPEQFNAALLDILNDMR